MASTEDPRAGWTGPVTQVVRRLWERDGQQESAPRIGLTLDRIVAAAIELADHGGLEAVSMSRLANVLGFTTMSLYRHVSSKSELLVLMQDSAWQPPRTFDVPADGWRPGLEHWCRQMRTSLQWHPWLKRLRYDDQLGAPSQLTWLELGLRVLADTPLTEYQKGQVLLLLNGYVVSDAHAAADMRFPHADGRMEAYRIGSYRGVIRTFADPQRFPALHRAVAGGLLDSPTKNPEDNAEASFVFGLDRILDGVDLLIATAAHGP